MKNEGNEGMLKRVSVDFCFVRSTKLENVGAILVIALLYYNRLIAEMDKGEHNYYKGEHKVRPYSLCVIEWFVLGIGGWGLCGAQNQLRITNYELRITCKRLSMEMREG